MVDENKAHYVVVTGIIIKDGRYLITKRSPDENSFPNLWTVPGGKLEFGEYKNKPKDTNSHWYNVLENLLRREVKEETNLEIKNIKYLTSLTFVRSDGIPVIIISLFADYDKGNVMLNSESVEHAWVSLDESKNYELIEGIYEELEMLDEHLNGKEVGEWSKKRKIGVDIDEVLVESAKKYLGFYNSKYDKNVQLKDVFSYNLWEPLGITKEESLKLADELYDLDFFENTELVKGAGEGINKLAKNNDLFVITSRPLHIKEKTEIFLKKNFPDTPLKVFHSKDLLDNQSKSKSEICRELGVEIIIEDHKDHALDCAENGIKVLLLDKPWNQNIKHENITKVYNWDEILEHLKI